MILAVRDSVVIGNVVMGILSNTGAANTLVRVAIDRTSVVGSATGVASTGNGDITIGSSLVTGNSIGVKFTAPATLRTYKTNQMRGNIVDNGTFSDIIPLE
jgi:nitrous oxidase accessory protein NosD